MEYNHDRKLESFQKQIEIIKDAGFNPIGVSQIYLEDTFIFKTKKEASAAYKLLEKERGEVIGWWYSWKDFLAEVIDYESNRESTMVRVYWFENI